MNKLKVVGLTALAGTFAIGSAQAIEMTASGSAGFTYSSADSDKTQNDRFSFGDSVTLSGGGDLDNGWNVTATYELDDGNSPFDDQTIAVDTGNGTFYVQTAADKGGHVRLVPNAYGSASYSLSNGVGTETGKHVADGVTGTTNLAYTNSDIAGVDVGLALGMQIPWTYEISREYDCVLYSVDINLKNFFKRSLHKYLPPKNQCRECSLLDWHKSNSSTIFGM